MARERGLSALDDLVKRSDDHGVWYFRVVEISGGRWACRHGRRVFDTHPDLEAAIEHMTTLATENRPAALFLHRLDGTIHTLGVL